MVEKPPDNASNPQSAPDAPHGEAPRNDRLANPEVRFEPTDISLRGVVITLAVFACYLALHQFLTVKLFEHDRRPPKQFSEAGFATITRPMTLPREPHMEQLDRLAGIKTSDVHRRKEAKESTLHSYGPTDEKGYVHVPIDWAIKQAADQIPSKVTKSDRDRGLVDAGEPNSGRMYRRKE